MKIPVLGILLCKGKDDEVVEYAMSRNIFPAVIDDYATKLKGYEPFEALIRPKG